MSRPQRILKHEIPVDFEPHELAIGKPLHVGQQHSKAVALWALEQPGEKPVPHVLLVVGTGHEYPDQYDTYFGTTIDRASGLVWHLVGYAAPPAAEVQA